MRIRSLIFAGRLAVLFSLLTACLKPWPQSTPAASPIPLVESPSTASPVPTSLPSPTVEPTPAVPAQRPNLIVVLVDDMESGEMANMPQVQSLLVEQGVLFTNFYVNVSLCCPSRASILRGQYAHNTQILGNRPPLGGFEKFVSLGEEHSTIATWLQAAGYRTALIGKYLNGYPPLDDPRYIPTGWDAWYSPADGEPYTQYNYTLNENGRLVKYGSAQKAYGTDVLAMKATGFLSETLASEQPFFVFINTYAPHGPSTPARRHGGLFSGVQVPRLESFNEKDVRDKPRYVNSRPRLTKDDIARIDALYRRRLRSLQAVDELVAGLVEILRQGGALDNTYLFFTSDNGFLLGQHRLGPGKIAPYQESIRVPLVVRGPGVPAGIQIARLSGNIDLAPTWAALAGAPTPDFVDGRSLAPLWSESSAGDLPWRSAFLIEQLDLDYETGLVAWTPGRISSILTAPRGVLEPEDTLQTIAQQPSGGVPPFRALRTSAGLLYVEYETGEVELYDLLQDPYQLENLIQSADTGTIAHLSAWLAELSRCAGSSCRLADQSREP